MNLAPVVARLDAEVADLKTVAGAAGFLEAAGTLRVAPAAFVLPAQETAAPNRLAVNAVRQPLTFTFGVLLALKTTGAIDETKLDLLDPIRRAVRAALVGWTHPDASDLTTYARGRIVTVDADRALWWQDEFVIPHQFRFV